MILFRNFFIVVLLFYTASTSFSQQSPATVIKRIYGEYSHAGTDSLKIEKLYQLAFYYLDWLDNKKKADSLSEIAIRIAEISCKPRLIIMAYQGYLESNDLTSNYDKARRYAGKALQMCRILDIPEKECRIWNDLAVTYLESFNFESALKCCNQGLAIAHMVQNKTLIAESHLLIGRSLNGMNKKKEASGNILDALDIAGEINSTPLKIKCYSELFNFYKSNKLYEKAKLNKLKQGELVNISNGSDSVALMWIQYYLLVIDQNINHNQLDEQRTNDLLRFALRYNHIRMKNYLFASYRTNLIDNNKIDELHELYTKKYPHELKKLQHDDLSLYYRIMAFFCEFENKPDSAYWYFSAAEESITNPNMIFQSNFFLRYGQFLLRQGRYKEAIIKFEHAYDLAEEKSYFDYMMTSSRELESIYTRMGDFKTAYYYSKGINLLHDSINDLMKKEDVIVQDINHDFDQRQQTSEKKFKQQKTQRNMMAGGIISLVIISLVIYLYYRNQKRLNKLLNEAKKQSDELLLNILPVETAEELKQYGTAKARKFDEVTVMFTDFKEFSLLSATMSAENLVKEIHFYYSEFDRIISNHNLEKIKIIGDSYMCAGGLPIPNSTHAHDVVKAALELQEFMVSQRAIRKIRGESYFELRIGINTGPLIAGIVGSKKFAYDIWGDTVNTASRLENTGEIDKVNISGTTYERVKDHFTCTYRGKVSAKHKGEIDMYFVEAEITHK